MNEKIKYLAIVALLFGIRANAEDFTIRFQNSDKQSDKFFGRIQYFGVIQPELYKDIESVSYLSVLKQAPRQIFQINRGAEVTRRVNRDEVFYILWVTEEDGRYELLAKPQAQGVAGPTSVPIFENRVHFDLKLSNLFKNTLLNEIDFRSRLILDKGYAEFVNREIESFSHGSVENIRLGEDFFNVEILAMWISPGSTELTLTLFLNTETKGEVEKIELEAIIYIDKQDLQREKIEFDIKNIEQIKYEKFGFR
ncbi:MAG: hypothetical protein KDM91_12260 [Verrucomicrobiae bacterium]|nr:hypothetical protein [Verrucomicrobiae bacterium]